MAHGDAVRIARLDGVEPGPPPAPTARWDVAGSGSAAPDDQAAPESRAAPDEQAVTSAPVAALSGADVEDATAGGPDPAAVADLTSSTSTPSPDAPVAPDLAAPGGPGPIAAGRTARLGGASRSGGRAHRRPSAGPGAEPSPPGRSRDDTRSLSRGAPGPDPVRGRDPAPDPDPAPDRRRSSADDDAPDAGDRPPRPRRRSGPKQIDPEADPVAAAREICLRLLTDRSRTRHELAQALSRRGVPDEAATSVLERFDDVGLIDDAAFAGQWVRSRHNHRGLARRAIAMELRRKGVDDEVASEALGEVDAASETRKARELVDRKLRSLTVDTPEQHTSAARRLVGMLARRGYGAGTAYGVVREALAAHGADPDELGTDPADD